MFSVTPVLTVPGIPSIVSIVPGPGRVTITLQAPGNTRGRADCELFSQLYCQQAPNCDGKQRDQHYCRAWAGCRSQLRLHGEIHQQVLHKPSDIHLSSHTDLENLSDTDTDDVAGLVSHHPVR